MAVTDSNDRIATVLERLADNQPTQDIGYAHPKFQERLRAEGFFDEFARPCYQNGYEANAQAIPADVRADIIDKVNHLRDGKYIGGRVTVSHDSRGSVYLSYKNATPDDRMRNMALFNTFAELINKIVAESPAATVSA